MHFRLAIVTLNQWALDFEGNARRIAKSIVEAHNSGAIYRVGPELELCGYSVEDGFYDQDTVFHCWRSLATILEATTALELVIDIGMPVHFGSLYNCRVVCHRGRVLFIRAKTSLAREGIYREDRHFSAWPSDAGLVPYRLPSCIAGSGKEYVPFGSGCVLDLRDSNTDSTLRVGWEICQELWDNQNTSSELYSNYGCHLIVNSSASYWELRKLDNIGAMIQGVSLRAGACYAYSNLVGCDGQRYVFSGKSCVYDRGNLVKILQVDPSNLFRELNIIYHDIVPDEIDEHRAQQGIRPDDSKKSRLLVWSLAGNNSQQCKQITSAHRVLQMDVNLAEGSGKCLSLEAGSAQSKTCSSLCDSPFKSVQTSQIRFEQEINYFVSLWLWDYLRRSGMRGFIVPLSGGLDSCCVATLVYCMCNHLHKLIINDDSSVTSYFLSSHNLARDSLKTNLSSPERICALLLKCCYLSTRYSGQQTESRAKRLCEAIGAGYSLVPIDGIYEQCRQINNTADIGPEQAALLDQNLQARLRMTMIYHLSEGSRIVLATGNVDEAIMGYLTKYDCSSADINPIGGLCKDDLKSFLVYCSSDLFRGHANLSEVLRDIIGAPPSAELTGPEQRDEDEMGITYAEISVLGKVRRGVFGCCGPRGTFKRVWSNRDRAPFNTKIRCLQVFDPSEAHLAAAKLAELVKQFFRRYVRNRHKLTVLTPALHAETYSPDDNRFDHRQILFPPLLKQFECIDEMVANIKQHGHIQPTE